MMKIEDTSLLFHTDFVVLYTVPLPTYPMHIKPVKKHMIFHSLFYVPHEDDDDDENDCV